MASYLAERKQRKELEQLSEAAVKAGEAVPTMQKGIEDEDQFPQLLLEIKKQVKEMTPQEKTDFDAALTRVEKVLEVPTEGELTVEKIKDAVGVMAGAGAMVMAIALAFVTKEPVHAAAGVAIAAATSPMLIDTADKASMRDRISQLREVLKDA